MRNMQRMNIDAERYVILERFSNGKAAVWDSNRVGGSGKPAVFEGEEEAKRYAVMTAAKLAADKAAFIFGLNHKVRNDVVIIEPGGEE